MKKILSLLSLAALAIGLLGSCSKINDRIDDLDKRVYDLENNKIASIEQQIAAINQSIADLETIRTNIQNLKNEQEAQGQDITALKAADITLEGKINDLKAYVDTELANYATKDWANATFASLEVQANIIIDVEKLKADLADLDTKLDQDIANLKTYIEGWVNTQLSAYYKKAEIDVKVGELQAQITTLKEDNETNKTKIAELESNLKKLTQDLENAKTTIKAEYDAAIKKAIEENNGTITKTIQSKIDEVNTTIAALTGRVEALETIVGILTGRIDAAEASIATIEQQIAAINQSISDLETIRTNIQELMEAKAAMGEDISELQAKDQALEGKITDLKNYVDTELANYATTEWANATFATLEVQAEIIADVAKLKQDLEGLDTKLDQDIANLKTYIEGWVNTQLGAYYKKAEVDVTVGELQAQITTLKEDSETNKTKIAELELNLNKLKQDLEEAKATIKIEYEAAIRKAIEDYNGTITETIQSKIDEVNATIAALTGRVTTLEITVAALCGDVDALKAMIQTVSIIPAYSNGSLKAEDGILTINCVITPKEAVESLAKENFTILTSESEVLTKSALYGTLAIAKDEDLTLDKTNGTATIKVDVSSVLPTEEDKALTVAVNIKNGISDFTTEFVPVYVSSTTTGTAKATIGELQVDVRWIQLWENGPKFAEYNVGVTNGKAESYGGYYTWGGIYNNDPDLPGFSWTDDHNLLHTTDNDNLTSTEDTATKLWGENWRMPTKAELEALINSTNCTVEWTTVGGVYGRKFTGKTEPYSSNSVFLPAAGYCYKNEDGDIEHDSGSNGYYWSSTPNGSNSAYFLYFFESSFQTVDGNARYVGSSVRAVLAE